MIYLTAMVVSFAYIAMKALQQRQVMSAQYWRMPALSYGMAFSEVFIVGSVSVSAVHGTAVELALLALAIGTGSSGGSILGTWLHARNP